MSKHQTPPTLLSLDGVFSVRFTDKITHKSRKKVLIAADRADAKAQMADIVKGWHAGTWPPRRHQVYGLNRTVAVMMARYVRERDMEAGTLTARHIVRHIIEKLGHLPVTQLRQADLVDYMAQTSRSKPSLSSELARVIAGLRWAKSRWPDWTDIPDPPRFKLVAAEPRMKFWDREEIHRLIAAAELRGGPIEVLVKLLAYTGSRFAVAHQLTFDRIDFKTHRIDFRIPGAPKTRKLPQVRVKAEPALLHCLKKRMVAARSDRVFEVAESHLRREFDWVLEAAGLAGSGTFHTFRHSWATNAVESGMSITAVAAWLACTPAMVMQNYAKPDADHEARGVRLYSKIT